MFTRVVSIAFKSDKVAEAALVVEEQVLPVLKQQKGFKGQLLFTDPVSGKGYSINIWESEDDLGTFENSPSYKEAMSKIAGYLAGPPAGDRYQVNLNSWV